MEEGWHQEKESDVGFAGVFFVGRSWTTGAYVERPVKGGFVRHFGEPLYEAYLVD